MIPFVCRLGLCLAILAPFIAIAESSQRDGSLCFDGRDDYVVIPSLQYDGSHPLTVEAYVLCLRGGSVIANWQESGFGIKVEMDLSGRSGPAGHWAFGVVVQLRGDRLWEPTVSSDQRVRMDRRVHIAGVIDEGKIMLFVDGKLQGSAKEIRGDFVRSKWPIMIGADPNEYGEPDQFFHGGIDEVRISNIARYTGDFSPSERFEPDEHTLALFHFDEGKGDEARDSSGNGAHAQIHGAEWARAFGTGKPAPRQRASEEKVLELIELLGESHGDELLEVITKKIESEGPPPGFIEKFKEIADPEQLTKRMVRAVQEQLDEQTIDAALVFLRTEQGQKFARVLPGVRQALMQSVFTWVRMTASAVHKELKKGPEAPPEPLAPGVRLGADFLGRSELAGAAGLGSVTDIRFGDFDRRTGSEVVVAGTRGAAIFDDQRRLLTSVTYTSKGRTGKRVAVGGFECVRVVDAETDGICEFLEAGNGILSLSACALFDHRGRKVWETVKPHPKGMVAGDIDGDGVLEFVAWTRSGLEAYDHEGQPLWKQPANAWLARLADTDQDGRLEILHTTTGGHVVVRDGRGGVLNQWKPGQGVLSISVCRWPSHKSPEHLLCGGVNSIRLFDFGGDRVAKLRMPEGHRWKIVGGTPATLVSGQPDHFVVLASVDRGPTSKRSILSVYDSSGTLVYEEVVAQGCSALAAVPALNRDGEVLLLGGKNQVWEYARSAPRERDSKVPVPLPDEHKTPTEPATNIGRILFRCVRDGKTVIRAVNPDGSNPEEVARISQPLGDSPKASPDGTTLLFDSSVDGNCDVFVMTLDQSDPVRLTRHPASDRGAVWSPDGKQIAFMSKRAGVYQIFLMDANGANQRRLTKSSWSYSPFWSPDGSRVAFTSHRDRDFEIYAVLLDSTKPVRLTHSPGRDFGGSWSPDGKKILFSSNRHGGEYDIYVMNSDGTSPLRLTDHPAKDSGAIWSPDGTQVAFHSQRDGNLEIYVMGADGSGMRNLSRCPGDDQCLCWVPSR